MNTGLYGFSARCLCRYFYTAFPHAVLQDWALISAAVPWVPPGQRTIPLDVHTRVDATPSSGPHFKYTGRGLVRYLRQPLMGAKGFAFCSTGYAGIIISCCHPLTHTYIWGPHHCNLSH